MYDIVTLESADQTVTTAVNAITKGQGYIPAPNGHYRFIATNAVHVEGNGGTNKEVLVVVGHGNTNSLSGHMTWADFRHSVTANVDWISNKTTVYLAACSTNKDDGTAFLHGNIAREVKSAFPHATVWASSSNVTAKTQAGDWHKL